MHKFWLIFGAISCLQGMVLSNSWAREWTSKAGQKMEAVFVDADQDTVTLEKENGDIVRFKIELLSAKDQKLIREFVPEDRSKKTKPKPVAPSAPKTPTNDELPAAFQEQSDFTKAAETTFNSKKEEPAEVIKPDFRPWTLTNNQTFVGKFADFDHHEAIFRVKASYVRIAFNKFHPADQEYIRSVMKSRGITINPSMSGSPQSPEKEKMPPSAVEGDFAAEKTKPNYKAESSSPEKTNFDVDMEGGVALSPDFVKAFQDIKLTDGTRVTPKLLSELPRATREVLVKYVNRPLKEREVAAQMEIGKYFTKLDELAAAKQEQAEQEKRQAKQVSTPVQPALAKANPPSTSFSQPANTGESYLKKRPTNNNEPNGLTPSAISLYMKIIGGIMIFLVGGIAVLYHRINS